MKKVTFLLALAMCCLAGPQLSATEPVDSMDQTQAAPQSSPNDNYAVLSFSSTVPYQQTAVFMTNNATQIQFVLHGSSTVRITTNQGYNFELSANFPSHTLQFPAQSTQWIVDAECYGTATVQIRNFEKPGL